MNKFRIVKSLLMNLPVSLTMSFVAQAVNMLLGHMPGFDLGSNLGKAFHKAYGCTPKEFRDTSRRLTE